MGIFAALFSSKPKPTTPPAATGEARPVPAARPFEPPRVVATSGAPMAKPNGTVAVPRPVSSAAALQMPRPVLPRSITQRLAPRPALPARSHEPFGRGELNGSSGDVTLTLGDVLPQIPVSVLAQNAPVDLSRTLCFPMAQLSAEMARGRPAVPLASVVRQCPELFHQPEFIDGSEMVRLPLQKLLEQIGKLKRIDYGNMPPALPAAPMAPAPLPPAPPMPATAPKPVETEPKVLPSWMRISATIAPGGPAADLPPPPPAEKLVESVLQPFEMPVSDTAETIAAEIIEIIPKKTEPENVPVDEAAEIPVATVAEPVAEAPVQTEDYEVPAFGDAPVVEMAESEDAILDVLDVWPIETPDEEIPAQAPVEDAAGELELPLVAETPIADLPPPPEIPALEAALAEPLRLALPEPAIQPKIEPAPVVKASFVIPKFFVFPLALAAPAPTPAVEVQKAIEPAPVAPVAKVEEVAPAVAPPVVRESKITPPPVALASAPVQAPAPAPAPGPLIAPRLAPTPVLPKFPFRAPRAILKASRPSEPVDRSKPTPPRSPIFNGLPTKGEQAPAPAEQAEAQAPTRQPQVNIPRLFGTNPLDRYFSTKVPPPVNWYAAGALLGVKGEVTPTRIAEAVVALPGITACLLAAPPSLTVSGDWPPPMGVDNSLAFARRLAGVLKDRGSSIVAHRQIVTDAGTVLVFAVDDLLVCAVVRTGEVASGIRQKLLVITKAMAHARKAIRKKPDS